MSTSIKVEDTLNEIRYADGINTALPIATSSNVTVGGTLTVTGALTAGNVSTLTTGSAGAFTVNGALTVTAASDLQGAVTADSTLTAVGSITATGSALLPGIMFGVGGPSIKIVSTTGGALPFTATGATGSIAINLLGTGPASRAFINAGGTAWTPFTTAA